MLKPTNVSLCPVIILLRSRVGACTACAAMLLAAAGLTSGCYQRVVSAKGFGADHVRVAEPYQESGQLDDWIFGPQQTIQRRQGSMLR